LHSYGVYRLINLLFQGTAYKRIQPNLEINSTERDKFWAAEEEKEKCRQDEERKKKELEQKKMEDERLLREVGIINKMFY
jgi:hypothetical protein